MRIVVAWVFLKGASSRQSIFNHQHRLRPLAVKSMSTNKSNGSVEESTIRLMTRLAQQFDAVNLSQGFPNEPPPLATRIRLAMAVLKGQTLDDNEDPISQLLTKMLDQQPPSAVDTLNQYSPPMGRQDLRQAVSQYYHRYYNYTVDPETQITITLGATEAFATALRTVGKPGDKVVILEPFHELYASQCRIFYLEPTFVTLRENLDSNSWELDFDQLDHALKDATILVLNNPHNPTGKVFTQAELSKIVKLCIKHKVVIITDDIYEHMTYQGDYILLPAAFQEIADQVLVCNSIGKSASATGWRVGWCLHPPQLVGTYRAIHDQLVVMSPHPMQYATIDYLLKDCQPAEIKTRYQDRLATLAAALEDVGFRVPLVQGAYYLFVNYLGVNQLQNLSPMDAAMYMLKNVGVACVPGDNFYGSTNIPERGQYLRFAACRSVSDVQEACRRIRTVLGKSQENFAQHDRVNQAVT